MLKVVIVALAFVCASAVTFTQSAQGASTQMAGAATGAVGGALVAGPIGAVLGGVGGAIVGNIIGEAKPAFRQPAIAMLRPSHDFAGPLVPGTVLPSDQIVTYAVPAEYGKTAYRYAIVNDRTVLVEPETGRIVQIVD
jgi:hypothetical protein